MSVAHPPAAERLSARLRAETRADHDAARRSGFLDALAAGRLPRAAYADLAGQHWFVYQTLERAAHAMADHPVAAPFVRPELARLPSLEADLRFLLGPDWPGRITATPGTRAYRARLEAVAFHRPAAFLAHHYTRYLGDLSGGQYLGPAIARVYRLNGEGHRFFAFPGVRAAEFRSRYRDLLDAVPWPPGEDAAFLAEVSKAYRLNIAVLTDLAARWPPDQRTTMIVRTEHPVRRSPGATA